MTETLTTTTTSHDQVQKKRRADVLACWRHCQPRVIDGIDLVRETLPDIRFAGILANTSGHLAGSEIQGHLTARHAGRLAGQSTRKLIREALEHS